MFPGPESFAQIFRQLGKFQTVFAGGDFVKDFSQRINIRLCGFGTFRGNEPLRAHVGNRDIEVGDETDVRELGLSLDENDIGGLDIAVNQAVLVQIFQGRGEREPELKAFAYRQFVSCFDFAPQCFGGVSGGIERGGGLNIIRQFHDVKEISGGVASAGVEGFLDTAFVAAGNRLEFLDAFVFAFVWAGVAETFAIDDLAGEIISQKR